jgi:branched-chain amino acid transport system substrate-binding protein
MRGRLRELLDRQVVRGALAPARAVAATGCVLVLLGFLGSGCGARHSQEEQPLAYRQAEDAFRLGDYARSAHAYQVFLQTGEREDLVPRAYYRWALSEFRRGRYDQAVSALDSLARRYPRRKWPQVYELRGEIEEVRGNTVSAIHWWEQAWKVAEPDQQAALERRIDGALARLEGPGLSGARAVLETPEMQALADARIRQAHGGPPPPPPPSLPAKQQPTPGALGPAAVSTAHIGCLLPLSGEFASYGQRTLNAIRLAMGGREDRLVVRDTQGEPQIARAAFDELVADPSVVAVLGPLRSSVAEVIAPRAERARLPLILLSQRDVAKADYVVQPSMTADRQAEQLAEYAITELGVDRAAVLYPQDAYGSALSEAFRREFERRNGKIVGTLAYSPGEREFSVEMLSVHKWLDEGLQAVFIPDYAENAVPLAEKLREMSPELVLLGSNGWNDPQQLGPASNQLEGAVFVDGFFPASTRPSTQSFVGAYRARYGSVPDILEAQAYDGALLAEKALEAGAVSRAEFLPALRRVRTVEGAAGTLGIGANGIQRELFLLRLSRGTISELAPGSGRTPERALSQPWPQAAPAD